MSDLFDKEVGMFKMKLGELLLIVLFCLPMFFG